MKNAEVYKNEVIVKSAELACETADDLELDVCIKEYTEQFEDGSYMTCLRTWLGYMVEKGNKKAIEAMKNLIRYRLAAQQQSL